jgi:outer membrane protein OmpU
MNKFKKIGLSALAGSLVATSAFAGEMSVAGGASINVEHTNGGDADTGKTFSMGNQLTFSGSGELDNGLNVALSFVLDQNDDKKADNATNTNYNEGSPFDSHSVTISSDAMGSLKFSGEGGSSAISAMDGTAAGDIWDSFDIASSVHPTGIGGGDNSMMYTLPAMVDGVALNLSYTPRGSADSTVAYSVSYTGMENLTVNYALGDGAADNTDGEAMKISYVMGPVTGTYTNYEYSGATAATSDDTSSYAVTYLLPGDELSITYGAETVERNAGASANEDVETWKVSAAYTAGGMTISGAMMEIDNMDGTTTTTQDRERWALGLSFAF